ncbi:MAG TPA: prolyl oligopeptidase family serine peptidase [Alphaproteobacteria bacterium]|nr:prolyl oligopeptidase family serine peptidase [Alphaproteobacteria bacterium]
MIDGPRLSPWGGKANSLVVFLHGYGADGNDLISIGRSWQELLPDTAFASPHAPNPCEQNPAGRQWFGLTRMNAQLLAAGIQSAAPALNQFLDAELQRYSLPPSRLALVGFSQGTMMSLHVGVRRPALGAILGYSGLLAMPEYLASEIKCRPPVLLIHGDADMTLPVEASYAAAETLAVAGVPVIFHTREGLGHGIDQAGLEEGVKFLAAAFSGAFAPASPAEPLN